ncbi:MAG: PD40 domain-containing protein [Anaerolineae bacterium]|nr:PD40 domain-containing protein [Anaerolineae bacterium]
MKRRDPSGKGTLPYLLIIAPVVLLLFMAILFAPRVNAPRFQEPLQSTDIPTDPPPTNPPPTDPPPTNPPPTDPPPPTNTPVPPPTNTPIPPPTNTPIPPPTNTPIPPTNTLPPTSTLPPTNTLPPSNTPRPTNTLPPTSTPVPSATPTPRPTNTPLPTNTPRPTNTPVPTSTPIPPTATPIPRPTEVPQSVAVESNDGTSELTIVKTGSIGPAYLGDFVTFQITISNEGETDLTNVRLDDPLIGIRGLLVNGQSGPGILEPGESVTVNGSYQVQPDDVPGPLVNRATVDSDETPPVSDEHRVPITTSLAEANRENAAAGENEAWKPIPACTRACLPGTIYQSNQTGDWEIMRLEDGSSTPVNVSQGIGADDITPSRSPNGDWIAFSSNRDGNWEVYIARSDGSEQRRITYTQQANNLNPVWGPNGFLVYQSNRDGNWELYLFDMTTGLERRLTDHAASDINPTWSPDGGQIAFQSSRDRRWQVYMLAPQTGVLLRLSNGQNDDFEPAFAPDSHHVAFRSISPTRSTSVITVIETSGGLRRVFSDPSGNAANAVWSPDGTMIAYQSDVDGNLNIYLAEVSSGRSRLLTESASDEYAPAWRCDSSLIFNTDAQGNPNLARIAAPTMDGAAVDVLAEAALLTTSDADDLYALDASLQDFASRSGRLPSVLTTPLLDQPESPYPPFPTIDLSSGLPEPSYPRFEAWTPVVGCTSECVPWVLYVSNRTGNQEIFRQDLEGDAPPLNVSRGFGRDADDEAPSLSPNGEWVAFRSSRTGSWEIFVADSGGQRPTQQLTFNDAIEGRPAWSPDGQSILYASNRSGNWELFRADVGSGTEEQLTFNSADDLDPAWSPDGTRLIFRSNRDGRWQLYLLSLESGLVTRVGDGQGIDDQPAFSPDGQYLAYRSVRSNNPDSVILVVRLQDGAMVASISDPGGPLAEPTWSADSRLLAYTLTVLPNKQIRVLDAYSSQTRLLTESSGIAFNPVFACAGTTLFFNAEVGGVTNVYATDALPIDSPTIVVEAVARRLSADTGDTDSFLGQP